MVKLLLPLLLLLSTSAHAFCWEEASKMYGIPVDVLKAIAKTESAFNQNARNINHNGSTDSGLMQINSTWLPVLKRYGIDEESLKNPCVNLKVGAWVLANNVRQHGWNWTAVGAYNVGCAKLSKERCEELRNQYAWKIHKALSQFRNHPLPSPAQSNAIPEYGSDLPTATALPNSAQTEAIAAPRSADAIPQSEEKPRGIMIVQIAEPPASRQDSDLIHAFPVPSNEDSDITDSVSAGKRISRGIGAFLNYEDRE